MYGNRQLVIKTRIGVSGTRRACADLRDLARVTAIRGDLKGVSAVYTVGQDGYLRLDHYSIAPWR